MVIMKEMSRKLHVVFDLGGVIFRLDKMQAIRRFKEIGVTQAEDFLDDYAQAMPLNCISATSTHCSGFVERDFHYLCCPIPTPL